MQIKEHNSSYIVNSMSNGILKKTSDGVALPLSIIFNKYLSLGIFLEVFKKAIIIPLFKNGDAKFFNNYSKKLLFY